jgi:hypothetical protein
MSYPVEIDTLKLNSTIIDRTFMRLIDALHADPFEKTLPIAGPFHIHIPVTTTTGT